MIIRTIPRGGKTQQCIDTMARLLLDNKGVVLFNSEDTVISLQERLQAALVDKGYVNDDPSDPTELMGYILRVSLYDEETIATANKAIAEFVTDYGSIPHTVMFDTNHPPEVREFFASYVKELELKGLNVIVTANAVPTLDDIKIVELPEYAKAELDVAIDDMSNMEAFIAAQLK